MSDTKIIEPSILILDDELPALTYMHEIVEEVKTSLPLFQNFKVYSTHQYSEFLNYIRKYLPKIIFLDIQMPGHNGIEVAQYIRSEALNLGYNNEQLPLIVFSTAHENYGYHAFKVEAIDYILKPVDNEKVLHVFNKIENSYSAILKEIIETIKVPSAGIDVDLPLKEVLYFKADMKYISVVTAKKEFLINTTLVNLEQQYPQFIKIHRAYLVNPSYIMKFYRKDNHWFLALKNHDEHLPVSRRQKQDLEGKLDYKDFFESEL
jgi:two-component system response regulator AlgR